MNTLWQRVPTVPSGIYFAAGLIIAVWVTVHILLHKREVASAAAWIGLAWFAPVLGGIAYFVLGVNRVQRRARKLRPQDTRRSVPSAEPPPAGDDHLESLKRSIGRITGRPVMPGNLVQILHDGDEAFPPMLAAIRAARRSVGLSSFIFHDDVWGEKFIDALAEAHNRGVAVRVLIDGIGGRWLRSPAYHALRRRGVPAARFLHSPLPWRMPFLNLRSHKKILVLDGMVGFTGGANISDANVLASHPREPVQDTHFRVEGLVVSQLVEAFTQDWGFVTNEDLEGDAWFPELSEHGPAPARVIDSGPDEDIEKIEFAILQAIACARESIALMTPYFLPDERLMTSLSMAAMRGVSVDVVIPSHSDHTFVDWASRANIEPVLTDGVRVWLCPPPFRHSKVMVVDEEWCLIGSCNWDIRSFRLNFELCMEVYHRELAATLAALMVACRGPALTLAQLDARALPVRLRDAAVRLMLPYL